MMPQKILSIQVYLVLALLLVSAQSTAMQEEGKNRRHIQAVRTKSTPCKREQEEKFQEERKALAELLKNPPQSRSSQKRVKEPEDEVQAEASFEKQRQALLELLKPTEKAEDSVDILCNDLNNIYISCYHCSRAKSACVCEQYGDVVDEACAELFTLPGVNY